MDMIPLATFVIVFLLGEAAVIAWWHHRTGRGLSVVEWLPMLGAGAGLMLALRLAVDGAPVEWVACCLTAAGVSHFIDLGRRWPRAHTHRGATTVAPGAAPVGVPAAGAVASGVVGPGVVGPGVVGPGVVGLHPTEGRSSAGVGAP